MKRRDFFKTAAPLAAVPFFSNRMWASALLPSVESHAMLAAAQSLNDRVLVVIQMRGGNDGLNMVLPLDQYSALATARANVLIPSAQALSLNGYMQTGLHPSMTALQQLFNNGKVNILQGVGYPSQNFSHFRSIDIWSSASNSNQVLESGWLGRYLEYMYPGFPQAYPNTNMPDPLAVQLGTSLSMGLQGYSISTGQNVPLNFNGSMTQLILGTNTPLPPGPAGIELQFIRDQQGFANAYAGNIIAAWNNGANAITYPAAPAGINNDLAQQLRIVARLISGGLQTKIYWVSCTGFDTHANQTDSSNTALGVHANLLQELSDAIAAFQQDLGQQNLDNRVTGLTFSEFGRRIKSNASGGTDHGAGAPMFVFGSSVMPGITGTNPVIPANASNSDQVAMQTDFRSVYSAILQNWFCLTASETQAVLMNAIAPVSILNSTCATLPIRILNFHAEAAHSRDALLDWSTQDEQLVLSFEIERSANGRDFQHIASVAATAGAGGSARYTYLDERLPFTNSRRFYYRLKVIYADGEHSYSQMREVSFPFLQSLMFDMGPNPSKGMLSLRLQSIPHADLPLEIRLTAITGQPVFYHVPGPWAPGESLTLDLRHLPAGVYNVAVSAPGNNWNRRWVLQH